MQYQYVVSAHKANSVTASVSGSFTAPHELNLVVAKGNRLEVHTFVTPQQLSLVGEYQLNGHISTLHFFQPADRLTGLLLVTSEKFQFATLSWDATEHCIATESTGEIVEITGRPSTEGKVVCVDPEARLIAMYAYQGIVHLFPMPGPLNSQALAAWRSLLRSSYSADVSGMNRHQQHQEQRRGLGDLGSSTPANNGGDEKWPYAVRDHTASKLLVPAYLKQVQESSTIGVAGNIQSSKGKGKATAHPARSTDIHPVLTRYIRELKVLDMQFLRTGAKQMPELAVLFEDANMARHVHVYCVSDDHGELKPASSWMSAPVEGSATKLIPLPGGAVIVVGDESLTVVSDAQKQPLSISKGQAPVTAWQWIDAEKRERLLLADDEGVLSLVVVVYTKAGGSPEKVSELVVERLGDIPIATSLSYLSDGCIYVGSHFGDQLLARLHTQPLSDKEVEQSSHLTLHPTLAMPSNGRSDQFNPLEQPLGLGSVVASRTTPNTFIEPLEIFQNLAPIVDLHVVGINESNSSNPAADGGISSGMVADIETDRLMNASAEDKKAVAGGSNYGSVVTCSGERNRTSLRVVRNGVGIQQLAHASIDGLVGSWSFTVDSERASTDNGHSMMDVDKEHRIRQVLIVLGLVHETRILGWTEPTQGAAVELEELCLPGWRLRERTIACGLTADRSHAVQVTPTAVVLVSTSSWQQVAVWTPSQIGLRTITAASIHGSQLALAVDGTTVAYLQAQESLAFVAQHRLEHPVSCINIHPWAALDADQRPEASFVALGMWEINDICLLRLPSLEQVPIALSLAIPGGTFTGKNDAVKSERAVEAATAAMRLGAKIESSSSLSPSGDNLPRSILMCTLGHTPYLLVGMGDGRMHQYALRLQAEQPHSPPVLDVCEHKCVTLGTRPLILTPFMNHGTLSVFAASDHPSVLFANQRQTADPLSSINRLLYANVDAADIAQVAPIDSTSFPESLCLVSSTGGLSIGRADPAQRLHVHSFPLPSWAAPHHLAHYQEAELYGVATIHTVDPDSLAVSTADMSFWEREALMESNPQQGSQIQDIRGQVVIRPPQEVGRFSILDSQSIDCHCSVLLRPYEIPESLCVASLKCLPRPGASASPGDSDAEMMAAADNGFAESPRSLDNVFVLGTSIVMPEADDASSGRILVAQWDALLRRMRVMACFTTHGAVYSLVPFRGMLLAAANNRLLLLGWQRRDPNVVLSASQREIRHVGFNAVYLEDSEYELVVMCSQQTQIASLSIAVNGDLVAVGDIMSSASVYRYEEVRVPVQPRAAGADAQQQGPVIEMLHRRLVPVARDYAGAWTTCVAAIPPPLTLDSETLFPKYIPEEAGTVGKQQQQQQQLQQIPDYVTAFRNPKEKRYLVADAYSNLFRLAMAEKVGTADRRSALSGDQQRLHVEARWHLGDQVNVIRPGSLVMDVSDPEFPNVFRPILVYGTLRGAVGVVANVENGKLGRILDRLQTNMAHLLPTPGIWDYEQWRGYNSDQRNSRAFGFLDGDLIEQFLDLSHEIQQLVFSGGSPLLADKQTVGQAEHARKAQYWLDYSRVEAEGEVAVLAQMAVSDIGQREDDVSLEYVIRLVESMTRLH